MAMDEPYELVPQGQSPALVELPVTVSGRSDDLGGGELRASALPSPDLVFAVHRDDFDLAYRDGTLYLLTLHPT
jgi:hypothetical protein